MVRNEDSRALKNVTSRARDIGLGVEKERKLQRTEGGTKAGLWYS